MPAMNSRLVLSFYYEVKHQQRLELFLKFSGEAALLVFKKKLKAQSQKYLRIFRLGNKSDILLKGVHYSEPA